MENEEALVPEENIMEAGSYEILRNRLSKSGADLSARIGKLNEIRKEVFGTIDTKLITTDRINTDHNCIPQDMIPVGNFFIFGYNVHLGLKSQIELPDVFSIYSYKDHGFHQEDYTLIDNATFVDDFQKLYKYYKDTQFIKFSKAGNNLYMIFRIGKSITDIKAFKWTFAGGKLTYIDNRSEHEYRFPDQHAFRWKQSTRDQHKQGAHPHISIEDKLFVETVGGDLTIKIEDNTDKGKGIYTEPVENKDQTLDDADIRYAVLGNLVLLKIKPYLENSYRHLVFNAKIKEVKRVDAIQDACVLLPDDQGILFPNGYYLQTGEYKLFELQHENMLFEKRIDSPNGEDFLYVFYNKEKSFYLLLPYNIISQKIDTPISCHGFSIFENGEMCFFKGENDPSMHHAIQVWQTPFVGPNFQLHQSHDSYLFKIGNKEIVRAMAEANELFTLIHKDDSYAGLYHDLVKISTTILDTYHWLGKDETFKLSQPLQEIRETANTAIDEFEKVSNIKTNTEKRVQEVLGEADELIRKIKIKKAEHILDYVDNLSAIRKISGEVISLKDLRYVDDQKIIQYEEELANFSVQVSTNCIKFLLKDDSLLPYNKKVDELADAIDKTGKLLDIIRLEEEAVKIASELEMLIEIVSNLKINDATETTRIIDKISSIYATFNQIKANISRRRKELLIIEGKAVFNAQLKLVDQSIINYIDISNTPEKCDEYLTKIMVQLEELEGKFSEFDEYIGKIAEKREEVYNAFESRKINLIEARNKRANNLQEAAERILKAVKSRIARFEEVTEINGYFAADLMIEKLKNLVKELQELGDNVKADDIQSKLKTVREDAVRQLKDKSELFVAGENIIKFGTFQFTVNTQPLELSMVNRNGSLFFHLGGTNFFEEVGNEDILAAKPVWEQVLVSENQDVYRSEYLAYTIFIEAKENNVDNTALFDLYKLPYEKLLGLVQEKMATRFSEGYVKGVHDLDATIILQALIKMYENADLLRYDTVSRACAMLFWSLQVSAEKKRTLHHQLKGAGYILKVFPNTNAFEDTRQSIKTEISNFINTTALFDPAVIPDASEFLFYELTRDDKFIIHGEAAKLYTDFNNFLKKNNALDKFEASTKALQEDAILKYKLIKSWLHAYIATNKSAETAIFLQETAVLLLTGGYDDKHVINAQLEESLEGLSGSHTLISNKTYQLNFNLFLQKLRTYTQEVVPKFSAFTLLKKNTSNAFSKELRLEEFKPRVMSSFVRNQLIDKVYLPLIGANLAKQIGTAGESKRTDLMGMLLLISPPGYGKTTLMEYIADRLGIVFMKINGPAIGHDVTSVDPAEAKNAGARQELLKLNLAFEMGDNVMIYLDDIQHCNPEFLQKFISLCDGQRKIEGVYKGRSKTYDFRGKKVCVVMAGNPYTESGEKFKIPDMLANRADIYNLGDIIGDSADVFNLSFIENSLTSNATLNKLAIKSHKDVLTLIKIAQTGSKEGFTFEANHTTQEINEYLSVLKKLLKIRDIISKVNQEYIDSAGQADEYRTEPSFKLQGSYRNMNKIAEKISPLMNEEELQVMIVSHYESEAQTLTTGAEANLLKFKEIINILSPNEKERWEEIKQMFQKNQKLKGFGNNNMAMVIDQIEGVNKALLGIQSALSTNSNGKGLSKPRLEN